MEVGAVILAKIWICFQVVGVYIDIEIQFEEVVLLNGALEGGGEDRDRMVGRGLAGNI